MQNKSRYNDKHSTNPPSVSVSREGSARSCNDTCCTAGGGAVCMDYKPKKKNKNYKAINRSAAEDLNLSLKAKGIMFYLLSKPDNWKGQKYDIIKNCKDGKKSVESGIRELKDAGYIRTKSVFEGGVFKGRYYEFRDELQLPF